MENIQNDRMHTWDDRLQKLLAGSGWIGFRKDEIPETTYDIMGDQYRGRVTGAGTDAFTKEAVLELESIEDEIHEGTIYDLDEPEKIVPLIIRAVKKHIFENNTAKVQTEECRYWLELGKTLRKHDDRIEFGMKDDAGLMIYRRDEHGDIITEQPCERRKILEIILQKPETFEQYMSAIESGKMTAQEAMNDNPDLPDLFLIKTEDDILHGNYIFEYLEDDGKSADLVKDLAEKARLHFENAKDGK